MPLLVENLMLDPKIYRRAILQIVKPEKSKKSRPNGDKTSKKITLFVY